MSASSPNLRLDIRLPLDRFDLRLDVTLDRPATAIFGPSGAGKTSLLETLAGLRRSATGVLRLGDEIWLDTDAGVFLSPERRGIGWVPQEGLLFPHLDVRGNLLAGAHRSNSEADALLDRTARLLEIEHLLDRASTTLSGGERQRVALGRALCSRPRLLLLDEPFAALDLPRRRRLLPILRRVREESTVPMLLISHDPVEVQALCDDLVVLERGRLVRQGSPHEVLTDPRVFERAAEDRGFENVLRGRVVRRGRDQTILALAGDLELATGVAQVDVGDEVLVGLRADDALLAAEPPRGLSARNILPARVARIEHDAGLVFVELGRAGDEVAVQITVDAINELGLELGKEVVYIVKATACRVYGDRRRAD